MMKKQVILFCFLFAVLIKGGYSQEQDSTKKKLSFMRRNFFHVLGGSAVFEGGYTPFFYDSIRVPDPNNSSQNITIAQAHSYSYITLICIEYEPRINFFNYKDFFSISFNMPVIAGVQCFNNDGFLAFKNAYLIDFNFFNHSTYNNINKWGGHFGSGLQMTVGPLIYEGTLETKRVWTNWILRGGVKFPFKGQNSFMDFAFGPGKIVKKDAYYTGSEAAISKLYFGIYIGILLGYE
jgi:hypothetical protein